MYKVWAGGLELMIQELAFPPTSIICVNPFSLAGYSCGKANYVVADHLHFPITQNSIDKGRVLADKDGRIIQKHE